MPEGRKLDRKTRGRRWLRRGDTAENRESLRDATIPSPWQIGCRASERGHPPFPGMPESGWPLVCGFVERITYSHCAIRTTLRQLGLSQSLFQEVFAWLPDSSQELVDRGAISPIVKPSGSLHPRVQKVGPEHFGIVAVDCAKARSKWMLADFYGRILIPPTVVEHNKQGFDSVTVP